MCLAEHTADFLSVGDDCSPASFEITGNSRATSLFHLLSLHFQNIDFPLPCPLEVFEMLVVPEQTYPLICVAVSKGTELNQVVRFGTVNPNSTSSWFTEAGENSVAGAVIWQQLISSEDVADVYNTEVKKKRSLPHLPSLQTLRRRA